DSPFPSLDPAKQKLARLDPEYRMANSPSADDILAVARDADAILVTYAKLPGELLRQLTRCKAIGRFGLGVDNIDLPAAKALGIAVNSVPDSCLREVSDHAMALLLALARKCRLPTSSCNPGAGKCRRSCRCAGSKARSLDSSASAISRARWRPRPRRLD